MVSKLQLIQINFCVKLPVLLLIVALESELDIEANFKETRYAMKVGCFVFVVILVLWVIVRSL